MYTKIYIFIIFYKNSSNYHFSINNSNLFQSPYSKKTINKTNDKKP